MQSYLSSPFVTIFSITFTHSVQGFCKRSCRINDNGGISPPSQSTNRINDNGGISPPSQSTNRINSVVKANYIAGMSRGITTNNMCLDTARTGNTIPALLVTTNRPNYIIGQIIAINLYVADDRLLSCKVNVNVAVLKGSEPVYDTSVLVDKNKVMTISGPNTDSEGVYKIVARTMLNGSQQVSSTSIKVVDLFRSTPLYFLYFAIVFLIGLVILIILTPNSHSVSEIFRFICITGIVLSVLSSLILTDLQIGANSPVGLIIGRPTSNHTAGNTNIEWVLNIGGHSINNFSQGILIPIYIIVFGFIEGYLRYLYKSARLKAINTPLREILLFRWNEVPGVIYSEVL